MKQNYLRQVMFLDENNHREYLEVFKEEPLTFWEFVNFMLGTVYDDGHIIEQITPSNDHSTVLIVYMIQII